MICRILQRAKPFPRCQERSRNTALSTLALEGRVAMSSACSVLSGLRERRDASGIICHCR